MLRRTMITNLGFYQRAVAMAPHPDKVDRGGEDSFMLCDTAMAVADGVGEHFVKWGVDAGIYARSLTREAYDVATEGAMMGQPVSAKEIVKAAEERSSGYRGTSTFTVATLGSSGKTSGSNSNNILEVANIGDSATLVLRRGKIVFKTIRQEHATNHPFQIGNNSATNYEDAEVVQFPVQPNDMVLSISDGILDNLFDVQIEKLIELAGNNMAPPTLVTLIPDDYDYPEDSHSSISGASIAGPVSSREDADESSELGDILPIQPIVGGGTLSSSSFENFANPGTKLMENPQVLAMECWYDTMTVQQLNAATRTLVAAARENSLRSSNYTPFTRSMITNGYGGVGNKMDDCTVVLAQVLESAEDIRVDGDVTAAATNHNGMDYPTGFMNNQAKMEMVASGSDGDALMPPDPYCGYP